MKIMQTQAQLSQRNRASPHKYLEMFLCIKAAEDSLNVTLRTYSLSLDTSLVSSLDWDQTFNLKKILHEFKLVDSFINANYVMI